MTEQFLLFVRSGILDTFECIRSKDVTKIKPFNLIFLFACVIGVCNMFLTLKVIKKILNYIYK